jgi:hypothetical protein
MAQSVVDICNGALHRVGASSILALTDNTREARLCAAAYDANRRAELRKHRWNFTIKRVALAPDAAAPAFDFAYQFTLPTDCLRVLLPQDADLDWVVEGRKILSNYDDVVYLRYVADITDVTQFDAAFYDLMAISLALDLCEALTDSTSKKAQLAQDYKDAVLEAKKINAFEQVPAEAPDPTFLTARL